MMYFLGLGLASVAGFVLGLLGGGGSILIVPILVYILGVDETLSTSYSLFVVGVASLVGASQYARKKLVEYKTAIVFLIPSALAVLFAQRYVLEWIPENLYEGDSFTITKGMGIMVLFAIIMVLASYSMIKGRKDRPEDENQQIKYNYPMIVVEGLAYGFVTGIIGAGGGFLIVPALVVLAKLPIKLAIGTSLLVISGKSLFGFFASMGTKTIDWPFLLLFTGLAVVGIFVGTYTTKFVPAKKLKKGFGWFVLLMGGVIIVKELFLK
jgi:uncharacterized membrane protein YfcA